MLRQIKTKELTWIDIIDLTKEDLDFLEREFQFHSSDIQELTHRSTRPKLEEYQGYMFAIVHSPVFDAKSRSTTPAEVDIFITDGHIITVHMGRVHLLDQFFRQINESEKLQERYVGRSAAYLLYSIMGVLIDSSFPKIDHIYEKIELAEHKIFNGEERAMVYELSSLSRDLSGFRQIIRPQIHLYNPEMLHGDFATPAYKAIFKSIQSRLQRVWDALDNQYEKITSLSDTNANLLSHKLNEFIKVLTLISALYIPLAVIGQVLPSISDAPQVNFVIFWLLIGLMLVIDFVILWYYRARKMI
ncbi:MAG: magnesium transporter CorA family protein [bacterium]|nr:magnesium transporter CorA family protein [bacterium]